MDRLMTERMIDTIIVPMHELMHASFRWMTRGAKVTRGYAIRRAGAETLLLCYPMEREEAAASGVASRVVNDFDHDAVGFAGFFDRTLREMGSGSRVAFLGAAPIHLYLAIADEMTRLGWQIVRSPDDIVQLARKTKSEWEIEQIRSVGERTETVIDGVRAMLRDRTAKRIGDLKAFISSEIVRLGMIEDHETIVSQGRDAGIPHSRGDAAATIRESVPLVIDIFPADRATGYFFDLTRTFCIGTIPDELRNIHRQVLEAFRRAADAMRPGTPASSYQALVCDLFEAHGHNTTRRDPATTTGYVHSLGHGVGLDIHEGPSFALRASNQDLVETGDVLTIEPGLYYPDREIGVRIEDTFVVREHGVETLCRGDYALEP
jgi:Xaa-Pro aminopeptidase